MEKSKEISNMNDPYGVSVMKGREWWGMYLIRFPVCVQFKCRNYQVHCNRKPSLFL